MRRRKEEEGGEKEPFNSVASQQETRCSRSLLRALLVFQKVWDFQRLDDSEAFIGAGENAPRVNNVLPRVE